MIDHEKVGTRKLKALNIAVFFEKKNINTLDSKGEVLLTIMALSLRSKTKRQLMISPSLLHMMKSKQRNIPLLQVSISM
ncbi:MAG: hypothetical protein ACI4O7_04080 [Aristaeellaceae bacterium]